MPKSSTQRGSERDQRNRAAGLVKVANSWIHASHKDDAQALIKKELSKAKYQKPKIIKEPT